MAKDRVFEVRVDDDTASGVNWLKNRLGIEEGEAKRLIVRYGNKALKLIYGEEDSIEGKYQILTHIDQMSEETKAMYVKELSGKTQEEAAELVKHAGQIINARRQLSSEQDEQSRPSSHKSLPSVYEEWTVLDLDRQNLTDLFDLTQILEEKKKQVSEYLHKTERRPKCQRCSQRFLPHRKEDYEKTTILCAECVIREREEQEQIAKKTAIEMIYETMKELGGKQPFETVADLVAEKIVKRRKIDPLLHFVTRYKYPEPTKFYQLLRLELSDDPRFKLFKDWDWNNGKEMLSLTEAAKANLS